MRFLGAVLARDSPLHTLHTLYMIIIIMYNVCNTHSGESRVKTNVLHNPRNRVLNGGAGTNAIGRKTWLEIAACNQHRDYFNRYSVHICSRQKLLFLKLPIVAITLQSCVYELEAQYCTAVCSNLSFYIVGILLHTA